MNTTKEGARKGNAYCYWAMGMLFADEGNNANAEKCFSLFLKNKPDILPDILRLTGGELHNVLLQCANLLSLKFSHGQEPPAVLANYILEKRSDVSNAAKRLLELSDKHNDSISASYYESVVRYLDSLTTR